VNTRPVLFLILIKRFINKENGGKDEELSEEFQKDHLYPGDRVPGDGNGPLARGDPGRPDTGGRGGQSGGGKDRD
jgi:hypothetical protein